MENRTIYVLPVGEYTQMPQKEINGNGVSPEIRNDQNQIQGADSSDPATTKKPPFCSRLFSCCKSPCCKKQSTSSASSTDQKDDEPSSNGCFSCCRKKPADSSSSEAELHPVSESNMESGHMEKRTCWKKFKDVVCCSRKNKVADMNANRQGCCSRLKCCRKKQSDNWAERRESVLSTTPSSKCCPSWNCCRRKRPEPEPEPESRRTSLLDKKKSLTPTVQPEKKKEPSIDESLVEHTSQMRGAIPVLPVPLAWFCLILNCILPGTGTIISGALCLCFGKPRFSVHDGPRMRVGAFIIDLIIGVSQAFTVLFCLVGWGWSIWWGVIMIKVARKHRKMKAMGIQPEGRQRTGHNNPNVDIERGQT